MRLTVQWMSEPGWWQARDERTGQVWMVRSEEDVDPEDMDEDRLLARAIETVRWCLDAEDRELSSETRIEARWIPGTGADTVMRLGR